MPATPRVFHVTKRAYSLGTVYMERVSGEGKIVCVTGASGYIGSWLVKHLLLRGYVVKATVRDPS